MTNRTPPPELVERVAHALAESDEGGPPWFLLRSDDQEYYRLLASAAIEATHLEEVVRPVGHIADIAAWLERNRPDDECLQLLAADLREQVAALTLFEVRR